MSFTALLWPAWWYTEGFIWFLSRQRLFLAHQARALHLDVWTKYLFVPMFGTQDLISRFISVGIRLAEIAVRSLLLVFIALFTFLTTLLYLTLPLIIVYLIISQFI